ncbi:MAG TPA: thioredoxin domain-containing protein [Anaerolineae bacterium]|nr:thioredoxin domain-containing protein [Anaerolineae bacterium]
MNLFNFFKRQPKAYHHIFNVTDANFNLQVIQRSYKKPLLVDYWAAWCGPCRQLGPILEKIALEPDSPIHLAKLDTETNPHTARKYNIRSIPAVKFFHNGQVTGEFVGLQMEHNIRRFITEVLAKPTPPPHIKLPRDPQKRFQKAKKHLLKGDGFTATIILQHLPPNTNDQTNTLLPLAQFLWDLTDGDALTGDKTINTHYQSVLTHWQNGHTQTAWDTLTTTLIQDNTLSSDQQKNLTNALSLLSS